MHDAVSWEEHCSMEIALLQGLDHFGKIAVNSSNKPITWEDHLAPLCNKALPSLLSMGQQMRVVWNMEIAHVTEALVDRGYLTKASKPYVGPNEGEVLAARIRRNGSI